MIRAAAVALALAWPLPLAADAPPEPDGYRMEEYRASVPQTLSGAEVVDGDAAVALWKTGRVAFVDVLPRPPKPENLPEDTVWRDKPRDTIPNAIWLPNTGYGELSAATEAYFRAGLSAATDGDLLAPVVLFCQADCWMSWNAGKRALDLGYSRVFWYPDGTDGWELPGHPLTRVEPFEPAG